MRMTGNKKKKARCDASQKKKKKKKRKKNQKRVPEYPLYAPRVPSLLKGRLPQSTVGASPAAASAFLTTVRRNARSLKHPRAPVVNTLSLDDLALVVSRGLALGKRETRAVHAPAVQRREHQPHVRTHVDSLEVVPRNLLPERHELVLVLPRVADELRPARRRSPTLGQQVVLEFHVQPPAQASLALVDVDVDVALLHRRVVRAPEPHERTRRDVPWRDVGVVQELGLGDVEEPRTSGRRVDPSRHVVGHQPSPESDQRSAAHRCRAACVRRPEHAPADVRRVLGQGRLQGRRVLGLGSCEERRHQGCDGLHFFFFFFFFFSSSSLHEGAQSKTCFEKEGVTKKQLHHTRQKRQDLFFFFFFFFFFGVQNIARCNAGGNTVNVRNQQRTAPEKEGKGKERKGRVCVVLSEKRREENDFSKKRRTW